MWQPDGSGWRARIGVLTPHFDPVPESELQGMAPHGVSIHAARVPLGMIGPRGAISPTVGPDTALAFAAPPLIDDAAELLAAAPLHAIVYGFTSSSYLLGAAADAALRGRLEQRTRGIPLVIPSLAAIAALRALAVRRLALIHPPWFGAELDRSGAEYFRSQGFEVVHHGPAPLRCDFGEIDPAQLYDWARAHVPASAEAIFLAGNGMRAVGTIQALEEDLGRPVLTANQVAFWQALRLAGARVQMVGYGRLLAHELPTS